MRPCLSSSRDCTICVMDQCQSILMNACHSYECDTSMSVFLTRLHHDTARDQGRHYAPVADHALVVGAGLSWTFQPQAHSPALGLEHGKQKGWQLRAAAEAVPTGGSRVTAWRAHPDLLPDIGAMEVWKEGKPAQPRPQHQNPRPQHGIYPTQPTATQGSLPTSRSDGAFVRLWLTAMGRGA